jgi:hypothetical protein
MSSLEMDIRLRRRTELESECQNHLKPSAPSEDSRNFSFNHHRFRFIQINIIIMMYRLGEDDSIIVQPSRIFALS